MASSLVLKGSEIEIKRALIALRQGGASKCYGPGYILRLQGAQDVLVPISTGRRRMWGHDMRSCAVRIAVISGTWQPVQRKAAALLGPPPSDSRIPRLSTSPSRR